MKNTASPLPKAIICDIDGTLALLGSRSPYDASTAEDDLLNHPVANILEVYTTQDRFEIHVFLITGREEKFRSQTERWLKKYKIKYESLFMRPTGDHRKDTVVKMEIYKKNIADKYDVIFVLEDRDQVVAMWRIQLGLTCLQVEYGDF